MAAHAVRVSRNCFNLSSSRCHFFHLKASETQSFILKLHLSTYKLQLFRFPTFSRYIFFWLPDQGRLRISRYCGNHLRLMFINPTPHFSCRKSKGINLTHPHPIPGHITIIYTKGCPEPPYIHPYIHFRPEIYIS